MGTRCSINFYNHGSDEPDAIIFRHWDGYPSAAGQSIVDFFDAIDVQAADDRRYNDATILASRFVVHLAREFARGPRDPDNGDWEYVSHADERPLDFLSVRVMREEAGDIEFRYRVQCGSNEGLSRLVPRPTVMVDEIYANQTLPLDEAIATGFVYAEDDE
jgi:hypothetical protein